MASTAHGPGHPPVHDAPSHGHGHAPTHGQGREQLEQLVQQVKPRLRGWLHTVMAPLVFFAGLALVVLGPSRPARLAAAVYLVCSLMLFGTSATYHRGRWTGRIEGVFRRWDHANIYLFIAGTYTPLATDLLRGHSRVLLLTVVWTAALVGILFRIFWLGAPRLLYTALYLVMGWIAIGWMPQFWHRGGPGVVLWLLAGGLVYTLGAVVYALKRPDPSPRWFGFHEIFHACTVLAAMCHYVAIVLATFR